MISFSGLTAIEESKQVAIIQNYPNPFSETTTIEFELKSEENVTINIYNQTGEKVRHIECNDCKIGVNTYLWNCLDNEGNKVTTGIYFFEVSNSGERLMQKLILVK
jgi:flagellar hook assembly protein FlgD